MTQVRAKTDRVLAIAFRRNVGSRTLLVNECPVLICVIAAICKQHGFRLQPHQCENASNNDPVHDANQLIVTTRQWRLLTGSRFARNVTPPKKQKSIQLQASKQFPGGVNFGSNFTPRSLLPFWNQRFWFARGSPCVEFAPAIGVRPSAE